MEERLVNLEIRYTHQEDMVESLSQQVHELQTELALLKQQFKQQQDLVRGMMQNNIAHPSEETPPPHY